MRFYLIGVDSNGAYVDSSYTEKTWQGRASLTNWIAVFHTKAMANAYVAYLNQTFPVAELKTYIR